MNVDAITAVGFGTTALAADEFAIGWRQAMAGSASWSTESFRPVLTDPSGKEYLAKVPPGHQVSLPAHFRQENDMSEPVYVDKARVIAQLRSRQLHARADWVDRALPELIDTYQNSALLEMLGIDLDAMAPANAVASRS